MDKELLEKKEVTKHNGCTNCGRVFRKQFSYCGCCGNRLVPLDQLQKLMPDGRFAIDPRMH